MFQLVESSNTGQAGGLAAGLVGFSFVALAAVMMLDRRLGRVAG
jgi:hypothetical protein